MRASVHTLLLSMQGEVHIDDTCHAVIGAVHGTYRHFVRELWNDERGAPPEGFFTFKNIAVDVIAHVQHLRPAVHTQHGVQVLITPPLVHFARPSGQSVAQRGAQRCGLHIVTLEHNQNTKNEVCPVKGWVKRGWWVKSG